LFVDEQKAYVSDLSSSKITIVNPDDFTIMGKIEIGRSSEEMLKIGDEVFVANWSAYNQSKTNNQVMVVNVLPDILVDSITVGIEPNSMVIDKNGHLWVLCSGGFQNVEKPGLWEISPAERKVIQTIQFPNINSSPTALEINKEGDVLYYINNAVFRMSITDSKIPDAPFIQGIAELPYHLAVSPQTNDIYLTDALDYTRNGFVYHFNAAGQLLDTINAGIIPGSIGFND
jgi:DNA-binding beta-propeller fold protein YncE